MEKPVQCNSCCKNGKHWWKSKPFASYSRQQGKYYYDDWKCDNCNVMIFGSSTECRGCSKRRPKKDDWYCQSHSDTEPICNYLNHSSRSECRKCGAKALCWLN